MPKTIYILATLGVLSLAACGGADRDDVYHLTGIDRFSKEEGNEIFEFVEILNNRLGRSVLAADGNGFEITLEKTDFGNRTRLGAATLTLTACRIELSPEIFKTKGYVGSVLLHELGHCFGKEHEGEVGEIMSVRTLPISDYGTPKIEKFFNQLSLSVKLR